MLSFLSYLKLNNIATLKSGLEVTQGHSSWYYSKAWVRFAIRFHGNYGSILYHFRDKARYLSKILFFHTPLHSTPLFGSSSRNIAIPFGPEKLEWWGYPTVKILWGLYNRLDNNTGVCQTDGWTDRQTSCHGIVRAMHMASVSISHSINGRFVLFFAKWLTPTQGNTSTTFGADNT